MATLLLRRPDVARHLQALRLLPALREALEAGLAAGPAPAPGPARVAQGALPGIPATCVTVEAGPGRTVLQLHQAGSGALLAVMEAGHLRTLGAAVLGALAADALARPDAAEVAVLGEGARASSALKALRLVRSLAAVRLWGPDADATFALGRRLHGETGMAVRAAGSAGDAVAGADLVVVAGEAAPPLPARALRPGAHLCVLDAGRHPGAPLGAQALAGALRVGDGGGGLPGWALPLDAELGAVLAGRTTGRTSAAQLTLFATAGTAALDLVAAWQVYQGALGDEGVARLELDERAG